MDTKSSINLIFISVLVLAITMHMISAQITTTCTSSAISSFTPCMNFITGSTNGGGSPTANCCNAVASLISSMPECLCLIFTGNVPVGLPINRTLAISLPSVCSSTSAPLQCKSTATPLPVPGPSPGPGPGPDPVSYGYGPTLPPLPPFTSSGTDEVPPPVVSPPVVPAAASPPAFAESPPSEGFNQGRRPLVLPSSAIKLSLFSPPTVLLVLLVGTMLVVDKI